MPLDQMVLYICLVVRGSSMLTAYPSARTDSTSLSGAAWIDLVDPTPAERDIFEKTFGLRVPTKESSGKSRRPAGSRWIRAHSI